MRLPGPDAIVDDISCPYCTTRSPLYFSFYSRIFHHCSSCGLIFDGHWSAKDESYVTYYQNSYFDDHARTQLSGQRTAIYRHALQLLQRHKKPGSLLDVGCGCGFLLKEAKECGWRVFGVDPSEKSVAQARSLVGEGVLCGTLDDVPSDQRFDAITMINVLDDMVDAWVQLDKLHDLLAPQGIIYLRFPNGSFHSSVVRISRMLLRTQLFNPLVVFHMYAITPRTIGRWLGDTGFSPIRISNAPLTGGTDSSDQGAVVRIARRTVSLATETVLKGLETLTRGRWVWGPSVEVIAGKRKGGHRP